MRMAPQTFILMWNPEISSMKIDDWNNCVARFPFADFNWSVYEHEQVRYGDQCYLVRVGSTNTGVVLKGTFISEPQKGDDWSGKNRITYYCDIMIQNITNTDLAPFITTKELQDNIPSFEWTKGHSGRLLNDKEAYQLEQLWDEYSKRNAAIIKQQKKLSSYCIDKSIVHKIKGFDNLVDYFKTYKNRDYKKDVECVYKHTSYNDSWNYGFNCNYDTEKFTLKLVLHKAIISITCSQIEDLNIHYDNPYFYTNYLIIYSIDEYRLRVETNDISITCKKISISKPKAYNYDAEKESVIIN